MAIQITKSIAIKKENLHSEIEKIIDLDSRFFLVLDENVYSSYSDIFSSFSEEDIFLFSSFETAKSLETASNIYDRLLKNNFTRSDYLIAIGGGITGDLAGFVASTYMRGLKFINIPTTLLAMVDSSIGGKTAVNYGGFKNMIGFFYPADYILLDYSFLDSLQDVELNTGMAEIIKIAMLLDRDFFKYLDSMPKALFFDNLPKIIEKSRELKIDIVAEDIYDKGKRNILNFGHTLAHSIEAFYNEQGQKISHGYAVAMGMAEIMRLCVKNGLCDKSSFDRLVSILKKYELPCSIDVELADLYPYILHDKKKKSNKNKIIISPKIGAYDILDFSDSQLKRFLEVE